MPYICLTRSDIPDGVVQVLDLSPNTSLRSDLDPPGQTKYVNRVVNDPVRLDGATPPSLARQAEGLRAYLFDNVEIAGTEAETVAIELTSVSGGDRITIDGPGAGPAVVLTGIGAAPNRAAGQFQVGLGTDILVADDLVATVQNATIQAAITAAIGAGTSLTATNGGGTLDIVTLTAQSRPGTPYLATTVAEDNGTPSTSTGGRIGLTSGNGDTGQVVNMGRSIEAWTASRLTTAADAIIARMDAGSTSMSLANINTDLATAGAGTELTNAGGSSSSGSVEGILRILSGEAYRVASGTAALAGSGAFTFENTVNDSQMVQGEWKPNAIGGDTENVAIKPVRSTVQSDALNLSLLTGHLSKLTSPVNTLFPNPSLLPLTTSQPGPRTAEVPNARVVVVYDDDGTLLS